MFSWIVIHVKIELRDSSVEIVTVSNIKVFCEHNKYTLHL